MPRAKHLAPLRTCFTIAAALFGLFLMAAGKATSAPEGEARGRQDFMNYCASCHGVDATGNGPVAAGLAVRPANLTLLKANNNGAFPTRDTRWAIDGRTGVLVHGPRDMPVWGNVFMEESGESALPAIRPLDRDVTRRIEDLVDYIRSIQVE